MAGFNYSDYLNCMMNGGYKFATENANRDEYRQGVMDTAKGIISVFDSVNDSKGCKRGQDGKLNLQEYIAKEKINMHLLGHSQEDIDKLGEDFYTGAENDFKAIDINSDGEIDYKEMANFLHLADAQDTKNSDGTCTPDGTVTVAGMHKILNKAKQNEKEKKLAYNYNDNNFAKLGEKGDIDPSKIRQQFSDECKNGYSSTLRFPKGTRVFVYDPNSGNLIQLKNGQVVPRSFIYGNNTTGSSSGVQSGNTQNNFTEAMKKLFLMFMLLQSSRNMYQSSFPGSFSGGYYF